MKLKRLCILMLAVMLVFVFSGCEALSRLMQEWQSGATPSASTALPTLPHDENLIPLETLLDYPNYTTPQISPDGSMVMYRYSGDNKDVVLVRNWKTGKVTQVAWPDVYGNPSFCWAPDGETVLFFVDNAGDENYGLYTTNIRTGKTKTLLPGGENNCYYVSDTKQNSKEIYIQLLNLDSESYDLYKINYETGEKTLILKNPGDITGFVFDNSGNFRMVEITEDDASKHMLLKKDTAGTGSNFVESDWQAIDQLSWNYEDSSTSGVYRFMMDDTRILYLDSSQSNTSTLYTYNPKTGETVKVFNDPNYDISNTWTDIALDKVTAVTTYGQYLTWHVLDPSFQDDYDKLSAVGKVFDIYGSSENDEFWLVEYMSDTQQDDFYVYDMKTGETTFLFNIKPDIQKYKLSKMEPFSFAASDGLNIEGYATFPAGGARENLPTVVLVHGGPWSRDSWGYNEEAQFLASRGYLVLQVNFRGSTGYGKNFLLAGDKQWGGLMHQDILGAVHYAIAKGWTDKDRVGVYGASYGGYEALICAAFSSDEFKCSVDAFGPSSLLTFIKSIPPQWATDYQRLVRAVGNPDTEAEDMKARSPLYHAADVKIPMLIAQGKNDVRVPQAESDQMVSALKQAGVDVEYKLFSDTGHGFNTMEARIEFYSAMEKFFAKYLGGKTDQ